MSRIIEYEYLTRVIVSRYRYTYWYVELSDLLQTAREGLCVAAEKYGGPEVGFRAYAWRVIYNKFIREYVTQGKIEQEELRESAKEADLCRVEFWVDVQRRLDTDERRLLDLLYREDKTEVETARILGVSSVCVRGRRDRL